MACNAQSEPGVDETGFGAVIFIMGNDWILFGGFRDAPDQLFDCFHLILLFLFVRVALIPPVSNTKAICNAGYSR